MFSVFFHFTGIFSARPYVINYCTKLIIAQLKTIRLKSISCPNVFVLDKKLKVIRFTISRGSLVTLQNMCTKKMCSQFRVIHYIVG